MKQREKVKVLFVCIGNACRSPMAEAIARQDAGDFIEASSAGLFPLGVVPLMTIETLRRNGYSSVGLESKAILKGALLNADLVINLSGHTKAAALSASARVEDWRVPDPYGEDEAVYQTILEEIQRRIKDLVRRLRNGGIDDRAR
jgi:arsenate reductase (thioredoxin)